MVDVDQRWIAQRAIRGEHAEGLLTPARVVEVRLDIYDAGRVFEQPDRPLTFEVDRLAVDLVEDTLEDQLSYAGRSVHDTTDPTRQ